MEDQEVEKVEQEQEVKELGKEEGHLLPRSVGKSKNSSKSLMGSDIHRAKYSKLMG